MKNTTKTLLILILPLLILNGCAYSWSNESITGNGNISTQNITTEEYDIIEVVGMMDIHLEEGSEGNISVTADENLQEYIEIEVKNNVLYVKTKEQVDLKSKIGVYVTIPFKDISKVIITGSGDIETKDKIVTDEFSASIMGSGDIDLMIEANDIVAEIMGSGDIKFTGSSANLEVDILGSGDFKGYGIECANTIITLSGSGNAEVTANTNLIARVNGSGDITYKGQPQNTDFKTAGSGDISAVD